MKLRPKRKVTPVEKAVLMSRLVTLEECAKLAAVYETKGASAGILRIILENRVDQCAEQIAVTVLLEEPAGCPSTSAGSSSGPGVSTAPGPQGSASPTEAAVDAMPNTGEGSSGPLDNVVELRYATDAGQTCHVCGQEVTWAEHLPPVGADHPVRCFVFQERRRIGWSVKVPE